MRSEGALFGQFGYSPANSLRQMLFSRYFVADTFQSISPQRERGEPTEMSLIKLNSFNLITPLVTFRQSPIVQRTGRVV